MTKRKALRDRLAAYVPNSAPQLLPQAEGRLTRLVGMTLEAVGINVSIGHQCKVITQDNKTVEAEVMGFADDKVFLMPVHPVGGVQPGAKVVPVAAHSGMVIGPQLLGRVINGLGQPLDGKGLITGHDFLDFNAESINPMHRAPISEPLDVGIRAINALMTVGCGQRIGLFAGSGVGKSVLLGMMTLFTAADIVVVALVGERGREVKEFLDHILGSEGLKRAVVVASPADDAPLMRVRASLLASRVAEYFRDQGHSVLLLMDSLTRYAQAQREIALSIGEPPATKGYPPSVFAKLPQLVERAGNGQDGKGSITAFYTVLTEGDDPYDPIADSARAILDGHIVLSRTMAEEGVYPAVDVEASVSRAMPNIVSSSHLQQIHRFKQLLSLYTQNKDLMAIGAYAAGTNRELDLAVDIFPRLREFIQQGMKEAVDFSRSLSELSQLIEPSYASQSGDKEENGSKQAGP